MHHDRSTEKPVLTNRQWIILTVCLIAAAVLRIFAAFNDFWLDEIWSLQFAREVDSAWDIIAETPHDNNHILNTLYLYSIGYQHNWVWYRLLAVAAGTASVALIAYISLQRGFPEAVCTALLAGFSYPLILYSSEARGYAPAIFFSLLSFLLIQECWKKRRLWKSALFWASAVLGVLSHLSFIYIYMSIIAWSVIHEFKYAENRSRALAEIFKSHSIPIIFISFIHMVHVRHIVIGGGPVYSLKDVLSQALLMAAGAPQINGGGILATVIVCVIFIFGIYSLYKKSDQWIFFTIALFLAPALVLVLQNPRYLYFRYFLVCFPFFYLLFGYVIAILYRHSVQAKIFCIVLLLLFITGNSFRIAPLISTGRGSYLDAVSYMAERTGGNTIVVGSDHDFRNAMLLNFYNNHVPDGKQIKYIYRSFWPAAGPDWIITHNQDIDYNPEPQIFDTLGNLYKLKRSFRYSGISGWHWFIYQNVRMIKYNEGTDNISQGNL
jgi:hypothetical protein